MNNLHSMPVVNYIMDLITFNYFNICNHMGWLSCEILVVTYMCGACVEMVHESLINFADACQSLVSQCGDVDVIICDSEEEKRKKLGEVETWDFAINHAFVNLVVSHCVALDV